MKKKTKDMSVVETNFVKWCDTERERLASRGKDIANFCALADPDINEGFVCCEDYTIRFNRDEGVVDLVVNGEEDSLIWDDVISNVPAQFASCLGDPKNFLYRLSTSTSEKKEFYGYVKIADVAALLPILEFNAIEDWKAENFDSLIGSMYNININFLTL